MSTEIIKSQMKKKVIAAGLITDNPVLSICKVCCGSSEIYDVVDFNRVCDPKNYPFGLTGIPIYYYRCASCGLLFTHSFDQFSSEGWANIIYNEEYYTKIDTSYEQDRMLLNSEIILGIMQFLNKKNFIGIDYGGGNGALSKVLQSKGLEYYTFDPYGISDIIEDKIGKFNFISAFEVLEHTTDPIGLFNRILELAGKKFIFLASTQCSDGLIDQDRRLFHWNYVAPRNGHVTIYSKKALQVIAEKYSLQYISVSRGLHLFGKQVNLVPLKYIAGFIKLKQRIKAKLPY